MSDGLAVGDADALIALTLEKDPNHKKAVSISQKLTNNGTAVVFPVTVFPEAITSLKRAANQPEKAHLLNSQFQEGAFTVEYLNEEVLQMACKIFDKADSKQNTLFDAIVAAVAKTLSANMIFSFDGWYNKLGFKLTSDLI